MALASAKHGDEEGLLTGKRALPIRSSSDASRARRGRIVVADRVLSLSVPRDTIKRTIGQMATRSSGQRDEGFLKPVERD